MPTSNRVLYAVACALFLSLPALSLAQEEDGKYQILVVDAFSSDVIPMHLMTREAVAIYKRLSEAVSPTYRETFETMTTFAELHRDIIAQFGRFPHRNKLLGRDNTPEEDE